MTAFATFDAVFVGAGHNALIAARYLAEDSGSVCLLDQRPMPPNPRLARSETFMDDPEDFSKRSRTGSPYENPTFHPTYGQPKDKHLTATRAVIASTRPGWLCGRLLRDALDVAESTRAQDRRYGFRGGGFHIAGSR
jgi:choline dehydrogenase-like flavoprotein